MKKTKGFFDKIPVGAALIVTSIAICLILFIATL
jgi:hypothetical protein